MRYIETQLILMNPIIPHFSQYCWSKYVYPVLSQSQNYGHEVKENLNQQAWPVVSGPYDKIAGDRLKFLRDTKSAIRTGLEKAKSGGKKKPKKGAAPEEAKVLEKCAIFTAKEYPEFQKKCLTIMNTFEFDENNKPIGDYVK